VSLLICDIGHSRLKVHHYTGIQVRRWLLPLKPFAWPEQISPADVSEVLLMGTNHKFRTRLMSHLANLNFPAPIQLGVDCRVPIEQNEQCRGVGNDRLAQALGALQECPKARSLVVSAGSALVIDVVENGQFAGGLIGLGWRYYREAMANINPLLTTDNTQPLYPGRSTSEAVAAGWRELAVGGVQRLSCEVDQIFLTGGDLDFFTNEFPAALVRPWLGVDAMARALQYEVSADEVIVDGSAQN
jgi:pantothenate kinase type III